MDPKDESKGDSTMPQNGTELTPDAHWLDDKDDISDYISTYFGRTTRS